MIEGILIELSTLELREHLRLRESYHTEKRTFYETQIEALLSGGVGRSGASNDPVGSLERSVKEHGDKQAFFAFLAEHLVPDEIYRLSESDFVRMEFAARYF